jgi:hypothetical protein
MSDRVSASLRQQIRDRSAGRCEYCRISEADVFFPHQPDHVIAIKHGGMTAVDNLAWSCFLCNRYKGSDLASIDPETQKVTRLYHPRNDLWAGHFAIDGARIVGVSAAGRATVSLLRFNLPASIRARRLLISLKRWPA